MHEPAKVFEDRISPGDWRVEKIDDDGGIEVAIFSGPDARDREQFNTPIGGTEEILMR